MRRGGMVVFAAILCLFFVQNVAAHSPEVQGGNGKRGRTDLRP